MALIFWYVWCASVAGDENTYITAAPTKDAAVATIPFFMRQDFEVRPATDDEVAKLRHVNAKGGE